MVDQIWERERRERGEENGVGGDNWPRSSVGELNVNATGKKRWWWVHTFFSPTAHMGLARTFVTLQSGTFWDGEREKEQEVEEVFGREG